MSGSQWGHSTGIIAWHPPTKPIPSHPGTRLGGGALRGTTQSRLFFSSSLVASLVSPSLCRRNTPGALLAQLGSNV